MAAPSASKHEDFTPDSRSQWREWLGQNHGSAQGVWLVYRKKSSGLPSLSYGEAVEEALCWGWIDSVPRKVDEQTYKQLFSPRRAGSGWSRLNKQRIESLLAQGLMAQAGLAKIEAAKADGSWSLLDDVENGIIPDDLQAALDDDPQAQKYFQAFAPSSRRGILEWLQSAKKPETRANRIRQIVRMATQNKRAQFDRE